MSANQRRKLYCVWNNITDRLIALDEDADKCAALMGVTRNAFYGYLSGKPNQTWTIIKSEEIESEDQPCRN